MEKKAVSGIMLAPLLISMLILASNIQSVLSVQLNPDDIVFTTNLFGGSQVGKVDMSGQVAPITNVYDARGAVMDASGDIIVAAEDGDGLFRVKADGTVSIIATGFGINNPTDVAVASNGDFIVTNFGLPPNPTSLQRVTPTGVKSTVASGPPLCGLRGIDIDHSDHCFVVSTVYAPTPSILLVTLSGSVVPIICSSRLGYPQDIVIDKNSDLIVADASGRLLRISRTGIITSTIDVKSTIGSPYAIDIDSGGNFIVGGRGNPAEKSGLFKVTPIGEIDPIVQSAQFSQIESVAVIPKPEPPLPPSGLPAGTITLTPEIGRISADGQSITFIESSPIKDADGNIVSDSTLVTVSSNLGRVITSDADPGIAGVQVRTSKGKILFALQGGNTPGTANIVAQSVQGTAMGSTSVEIIPRPEAIFVDVSNTGFEDGSKEHPYNSIQEGIDASGIGDMMIRVAQGTYYENVLVTKDKIILQGSGSDVTIIDGQGKNNVVYAYEITTFTIEDCTVRNSSYMGSMPGSVGIVINPSGRWGGNFAISRCKVQDNWGGVAIWNHAWGTIVIENNIISNNDAIGLDASYPIFDGKATIRSNTIAYNGWDGYFDWAGGGYRSLINNIIVSNRFGIHSHRDTPRYIMYNDVWNNSEGNYIQSYGWYGDIMPFTPSPGTGEISTNPLFVDAANRNYRLSESSPCIDAGTNENAPSIDIEGNPRPIDGNRDDTAVVDMGAFEFIPIEVVMATVDIDPDTLNLKSKGKWITAYIQLPEDYNAADIDAATILLNDTISPVLDPKYGFVTNSSEYLVDHNNDGIFERMVKFDRASVESLIYSQGFPLGEVALTITGELLDGTPFEGTDIIFVVHGGGGGRRK